MGEEEEAESEDWGHGQVPHLWARRGKELSGREAEAREVGGKGSEPWTRRGMWPTAPKLSLVLPCYISHCAFMFLFKVL